MLIPIMDGNNIRVKGGRLCIREGEQGGKRRRMRKSRCGECCQWI